MDAPYSGGAGATACMRPRHMGSGEASALPSPPATDRGCQPSPLPSSVTECHFTCPDHYALATQPCMLVKSEQQPFWPSPPLGPWDFEHGHGPAPRLLFCHDYAGTPVSSDSWPSVEAALLGHGDKFENQPLPGHGAGAALYTPTSAAPSGVLDGAFGELSGLPLSMEALEAGEELFMTVTPEAGSPPPTTLYEVPEVHYMSSRDTSVDEVTADGKLDEPYAKLIYRAFLSRPDYAMSLQDIYQWFRDNTTKAVSAKGGWQNSIRHNLSMNAAFTKRHRRDDERGYSTSAEEAKRTNEWVLEGWAVFNGVQSTTRYRKGNSRRRSSARLASPGSKRPTQHSAKRAMSGRKGGCAARDSRLRGRSFFHGEPMSRGGHYGLFDPSRFSPPRSTYPAFYSPEPAASMHRLHHGPRTNDAMAFALAMGPDDVDGALAASYALPGFVDGVRDVHMGYHGDQHVAEASSSAPLLASSVDDAIYDCADGSD